MKNVHKRKYVYIKFDKINIKWYNKRVYVYSYYI